MKYHITQLIDVENLQSILESFYEITNFPNAIVDVAGNILKLYDKTYAGAGWTSICSDFHRIHPDSKARCFESDTILSKISNENQRYSLYYCKNGMADVSIPIIIDGDHLANLFTGQFLLESPDIDYFRKQAVRFDYDIDKYLDALSEVPIINEKVLEPILIHMCNLADLISQMGLKEKKILDLYNKEGKVKSDKRRLMGILPMCCFCNDIRTSEGEWEKVDHYIQNNSQADVSHTFCPTCFEKHYPDQFKRISS